MKCKKAEKLILLQDSGELTGFRMGALSAHLDECEGCRSFKAAMVKAREASVSAEEPGVKAVQNVLREARLNAPEKRPLRIIGLKPALAVAASFVIGLGIFLSVFSPGKVGMELVVTETQLLDLDDQVISVMYSGLSEDDLAFNFLMTYNEG